MKSFFKLQLTVAAVLLSAASFSSATPASSLDGEWQGAFQCAPSPTDPVKVPAYSSSFNLTVKGGEASGSRVAPKVTEVLKGVIDADGTLKLTGTGQLKSGDGRPWTTKITGSFAVDSFAGKGGMFDSSGKQVRDCTLSLSHVGVARSRLENADGGSSQVVPKYLELARELVATVKPENNRYNREAYHPAGVQWKGEPGGENKVDAACVNLVNSVLDNAKSPFFLEMKARVQPRRQAMIQLVDFAQAVSKEYGVRRVTQIEDVEPGDIWLMTCFAAAHCSAQGLPAPGHVAFVDVKPYKQESKPPFVPGTTQWVVTVIDSNTGPISSDDTRNTPLFTSNTSGVGRGSFRIFVNEAGVQVGWSKGFAWSKFVPFEKASVLFAHPKY